MTTFFALSTLVESFKAFSQIPTLTFILTSPFINFWNLSNPLSTRTPRLFGTWEYAYLISYKDVNVIVNFGQTIK